jgi:hypothetical protein
MRALLFIVSFVLAMILIQLLSIYGDVHPLQNDGTLLPSANFDVYRPRQS